MKMIVRTDFVIQTLLVVLYIVFLVLKGIGEHTLVTGMILVSWQMLSCLAMIAVSKKRRTDCMLMFIIASVTLVALNMVFIIAGWFGSTVTFFIHGLPPILITYYYIVTMFSIVRRDNHKGKFLPHTSF